MLLGASTADEPNALSADAGWLACFSLEAVSQSQSGELSAWERAQGPVFQATDLEMARFSLVAQTVKTLLVVWEAWVQSLGWEDLLEEGMATHSSILAWKIPWTESWRATVHRVAQSWRL